MASSSRGPTLCALLLIAVPGCWTGRLIEAGRLRESVVAYTSAALEGEELRLDYTVEVYDASAQPQSMEERSATIALATLAVRPEQAVDEYPIRRVPTGSRTGREVPIAMVVGQLGVSPLTTTRSHAALMLVEVDVRTGRHVGFRLCATTGAQCQGYFHSVALYYNHIAWWVYPVAALTASIDAALVPLQAVTLPLMFAFGD